MYDLDWIVKESKFVTTEIDGEYVPCRPEKFWGIGGFIMRFEDAWKVLTGKADAFTWPKGQ